MFTMAPPPCSAMCAAATCIVAIGARVLTAKIRSNVSFVTSISGPPGIVPAQFTSACTRPRRVIALGHHRLRRVEVGQVDLVRRHPVGIGLGAHPLQAVGEDVGGEHARPLREERLDDAASDPLSAAGHDHVAVGEASHHGTSG